MLRRLLPRVLPAVTEHLASALSGRFAPEPGWSELEWRIARAVAIIHGISPLLSRRLTWKGQAGWQAFLDDQRVQTAGRYQRMTNLLARIDELARLHYIAFVPLKGEALHAIGLYTGGDRPMADIDLLLKQSDLALMVHALSQLGYQTLSSTAHEHVLVPRERPPLSHLGERADQGITIELHTRIDRPMPVRVVDITAQLWTAAPKVGRNDYPSLGSLMRHLLMHAAVNMQIRILRMLQLHDIALLAPQLSDSDWTLALAPEGEFALSWWALPPLQLTAHYYPGVIPAAAIDSTATGCSALLRALSPKLRISHVSVSNLRRSLFPALSWSGSFPEALNCLGSRMHSGLRAVRGHPQIPDATELQPWITRSHRRRFLEVLIGRARPETLMAVTAALNSDQPLATDHASPKAA